MALGITAIQILLIPVFLQNPQTQLLLEYWTLKASLLQEYLLAVTVFLVEGPDFWKGLCPTTDKIMPISYRFGNIIDPNFFTSLRLSTVIHGSEIQIITRQAKFTKLIDQLG